jgi:hypothetical protein
MVVFMKASFVVPLVCANFDWKDAGSPMLTVQIVVSFFKNYAKNCTLFAEICSIGPKDGHGSS